MRLYRSHKQAPSDNNLIPMINVVFLLLIFFMVAGTIDPAVPIDTTPPDSSQRRELSAARTLHVSVDGSMALDTQSVTLETLGNALLTPEPSRTDDAMVPLAIRADGNLALEQLQPVLDTLRNAGVARVELVTTWAPADNR